MISDFGIILLRPCVEELPRDELALRLQKNTLLRIGHADQPHRAILHFKNSLTNCKVLSHRASVYT
jgi:hypothetical protein